MGLFRKKNHDTPPPASAVDPAELASLRAEMATLQRRLDASERSKTVLEERVEELGDRLTEQRLTTGAQPTSTPPPTPPPAPASTPTPPPPVSLDETPPIGMIRVDDLAARIDELAALVDAASHDAAGDGSDEATDESAEQLEALRRQLEAVTNRMDALDLRVTNVSTELANQLTELSGDIEQLAQRPAADDREAPVDTDELEARLAERLDVAIDEVHDSTERLAAEQARYQIQFRQDLAELAERLRRPGAS